MSAKLLAGNLVEITYANRQADLEVWNSKIYHGAYGFGRFIRWLRQISPSGNRDEKLHHACQNTRQIFFTKISQLNRANRHLRNGFAKLLIGQEIQDPRFYQAKNRLLAFSSYLDPFMKSVRKEKVTRALAFLLGDIRDKEKVQAKAAAIKDLFEELHFYQRIFIFEEVTKTKIPLHLLQKMSFDRRLNVKENEKVKKWLAQIEHAETLTVPSFKGKIENTYVQTRSLHRMLCKIVSFINTKLPKLDEEYTSSVEALEANLIDYGYQIFDQADYKHILWRDSIDEGEEIEWNDKFLVLGKILYNPERNHLFPIVFSVVDEPAFEVVIYQSESISYLKRFQESLLHCGLEGPKLLGISEFGRVVIQERLHDTLADIQWESDEECDLSLEDKVKARPIIKLLHGLKNTPFTPLAVEVIEGEVFGRLHPEHFAFNAQGQLKAKECLTPGNYSFDVLEDFAFECAQGNWAVFAYIMVKSGLSKVPAAKEYQKLFASALGNQNEFVIVTKNSSITDHSLIEKRVSLFRALKLDFQECQNQNLEVYKFNKKALQKQLKTELIRLSQSISPGGKLNDNIFSFAMRDVCLILLPEMKKPFFENKIKQIIALNDPAFLIKDDPIPYRQRGIYSKKQIKAARKRVTKAALALAPKVKRSRKLISH